MRGLGARIRVAVGLGVMASAAWAQGAPQAQGAAAPPRDEHVRGEVASASGDTLSVKTKAGQTVEVKLAPDVKVSKAEKTDLGSVEKGTFIGTTAVPQADGSLRAIEVHVFPEAMRGTGEGHRPWDLGGTKSTMTNATVANVKKNPGHGGTGSTMTNATVQGVQKTGGGETLALEYKGGKKTVLVPAGTPIVKLEPGDRSLLEPGAHVFVIASREQDGSLVAKRIVAGKDVEPPM
jgi:hypothetical protein